MVSVYTRMNANSLAIFLMREKTLSATSFAMSDEVKFVPPKAMLGVMETFAADKTLNVQFNEAYKNIREGWARPVDGEAHVIIQAMALEHVILENREKFPPEAFKIVLSSAEGQTHEIPIPDKIFSAGKIFKKDQARREEDFKAAEEAKEAEKQRNEARTVTPAEEALKNLLAVATLQSAEREKEDGAGVETEPKRHDPAKAAEQAYRAS